MKLRWLLLVVLAAACSPVENTNTAPRPNPAAAQAALATLSAATAVADLVATERAAAVVQATQAAQATDDGLARLSTQAALTATIAAGHVAIVAAQRELGEFEIEQANARLAVTQVAQAQSDRSVITSAGTLAGAGGVLVVVIGLAAALARYTWRVSQAQAEAAESRAQAQAQAVYWEAQARIAAAKATIAEQARRMFEMVNGVPHLWNPALLRLEPAVEPATMTAPTTGRERAWRAALHRFLVCGFDLQARGVEGAWSERTMTDELGLVRSTAGNPSKGGYRHLVRLARELGILDAREGSRTRVAEGWDVERVRREFWQMGMPPLPSGEVPEVSAAVGEVA